MSGTLFQQITNLGANAVGDLMEDSITGAAPARFINRPSRVTVAIVANATQVELTIISGTRTIVPRSTLNAGGTTGVFPNVNEIGFSFFAAAGEQLQILVRETGGVATTDIMASVDISPVQ